MAQREYSEETARRIDEEIRADRVAKISVIPCARDSATQRMAGFVVGDDLLFLRVDHARSALETPSCGRS